MQFIRRNKDPPSQRSGVGYFRVQTSDGVVEMTPIEREMYRRMKGAGLVPQCQVPIGPYRLDFAFGQEKVAVEVDGSRWHQNREKDATRDRYLEGLGWKVMRITGAEAVKKRTHTLLAPIFAALGRKYPSTANQRFVDVGGRGGRAGWDRHYSIDSYYRSKH